MQLNFKLDDVTFNKFEKMRGDTGKTAFLRQLLDCYSENSSLKSEIKSLKNRNFLLQSKVDDLLDRLLL